MEYVANTKSDKKEDNWGEGTLIFKSEESKNLKYLRTLSGTEVLLRGGEKVQDDQRGLFNYEFDSKIYKSRLRLRRWLIGIIVFLLTSLVIINTYTTDQFPAAHFGTVLNITSQEEKFGESLIQNWN
ncbi:uncharacterized protein LOC144471504 [Augochlora pura]